MGNKPTATPAAQTPAGGHPAHLALPPPGSTPGWPGGAPPPHRPGGSCPPLSRNQAAVSGVGPHLGASSATSIAGRPSLPTRPPSGRPRPWTLDSSHCPPLTGNTVTHHCWLVIVSAVHRPLMEPEACEGWASCLFVPCVSRAPNGAWRIVGAATGVEKRRLPAASGTELGSQSGLSGGLPALPGSICTQPTHSKAERGSKSAGRCLGLCGHS